MKKTKKKAKRTRKLSIIKISQTGGDCMSRKRRAGGRFKKTSKRRTRRLHGTIRMPQEKKRKHWYGRNNTILRGRRRRRGFLMGVENAAMGAGELVTHALIACAGAIGSSLLGQQIPMPASFKWLTPILIGGVTYYVIPGKYRNFARSIFAGTAVVSGLSAAKKFLPNTPWLSGSLDGNYRVRGPSQLLLGTDQAGRLIDKNSGDFIVDAQGRYLNGRGRVLQTYSGRIGSPSLEGDFLDSEYDHVLA
jgi:hypothetical protein